MAPRVPESFIGGWFAGGRIGQSVAVSLSGELVRGSGQGDVRTNGAEAYRAMP